jgi:hypothetical protein
MTRFSPRRWRSSSRPEVPRSHAPRWGLTGTEAPEALDRGARPRSQSVFPSPVPATKRTVVGLAEPPIGRRPPVGVLRIRIEPRTSSSSDQAREPSAASLTAARAIMADRGHEVRGPRPTVSSGARAASYRVPATLVCGLASPNSTVVVPRSADQGAPMSPTRPCPRRRTGTSV